jgi:DtxR family Mn-dependent transcriptional regulator|tara:strand:- start:120 stop:428 length:309 start_codon:yes stop_codon:yes gene_type:complete
MSDDITVLRENVIKHTHNDDSERLSSLRLGESGSVVSLSTDCRGQERRRLMDLGILPGTVISAEMRSPSGDPTAYRIREALIALRHEQADMISITRVGVTSI